MTVRMLAIAVLLAVAGGARAAEPAPPDVLRGERYDGRATPPATAREAWLAVPRALLWLPRQLMRGVGAAARPVMEWSERNHVPETVESALTSDDGRIGVRPVINYETAYRPSYGVSFFDERLPRGARVAASSSFGGPATVADDARLTVPWWQERLTLQLDVAYRRRDDELYTGIGMARRRAFARYQVDQGDAGAALAVTPMKRLRIEVGVAVGLRRFADGNGYDDERSIGEVYCERTPGGHCLTGHVDEALVPGFGRGTQFVREHLTIRADSRADETRSGIVAEGGVEYTAGVAHDHASYLRLRAHVGTQLELWRRRALYLGLTVEDELRLGGAPIPFSERVTLGGAEDLRGFQRGRFRDASSVVGTVEYRWPVWMWMDGSLFADYGGVFGPGLKGLGASQLRPDVGFGVRVRLGAKFLVRLQVAYGFGDGGGWRLVIAGNGNPS